MHTTFFNETTTTRLEETSQKYARCCKLAILLLLLDMFSMPNEIDIQMYYTRDKSEVPSNSRFSQEKKFERKLLVWLAISKQSGKPGSENA